MVIGALVPPIGDAIKGAMILQNVMGDDAPWFCDEKPVDDAGEPCSGWVRQDESRWVWLNVTKALVVRLVFVAQSHVRISAVAQTRRRFSWRSMSTLVADFKNFSKLVLADTQNCVLIVPVS